MFYMCPKRERERETETLTLWHFKSCVTNMQSYNSSSTCILTFMHSHSHTQPQKFQPRRVKTVAAKGWRIIFCGLTNPAERATELLVAAKKKKKKKGRTILMCVYCFELIPLQSFVKACNNHSSLQDCLWCCVILPCSFHKAGERSAGNKSRDLKRDTTWSKIWGHFYNVNIISSFGLL